MGTAPPELSQDRHCSHPDTSLLLITRVDFSANTVALTLTPYSVPSLLTSAPAPLPRGAIEWPPSIYSSPHSLSSTGPLLRHQSHHVTPPCSESSPSPLSHSQEDLRAPKDPQDSLRPKALPRLLCLPSAPLLQVFSASFIFLQPHWPTCCSLNLPDSPQGLCTFSFICLEILTPLPPQLDPCSPFLPHRTLTFSHTHCPLVSSCVCHPDLCPPPLEGNYYCAYSLLRCFTIENSVCHVLEMHEAGVKWIKLKMLRVCSASFPLLYVHMCF